MDIKEVLSSLPPPDPQGPERVWRRKERAEEHRRRTAWVFPIGLLVASAILAIAFQPASERQLELATPSGHTEAVAWSDTVSFTFEGSGRVQGTADDLVIAWEDGTLHAQVEPGTGTGLEVRTTEASVRVVGTVFRVHRDAMGTTTTVEEGKVEVACTDGWQGLVTAESGPHVCLPTRPAMLLGRASALRDRGRDTTDVLATLDRGIELASTTSVIRGELLALRMEVLSEAGDYARAISDADAYLALDGPRSLEVTRFAAWLALSDRGCDQGLVYLEALGEQATTEDRILHAECVVADDPVRARLLLRGVDSATLEPSWADRARTVMGRIDGESQ